MWSSNSSNVIELLSKLQKLDTACLCDADKSVSREAQPSYHPLQVIQGLTPRTSGVTIAGIVRTIQCSQPNDFLAVLDGLEAAEQHEILVVHTKGSTRAVAGELFCAEAQRRGVTGIIVDGPMRDTKYLMQYPSVRCFSTSVTPYSGTTQHLGENQVPVECCGVLVNPNQIVVADDDGIIVASAETFATLVPIAEKISEAEDQMKDRIVNQGQSFHSMTNYKEHIDAMQNGRASSFEFRQDTSLFE